LQSFSGGDGEQVSHAREVSVSLDKRGDRIQRRFIEGFALLPLACGLRGGRNRRGVGLQFLRKIMRIFRPQTVLQPLAEDQRIPQIQDRALIRGTLHRFELVRLLTLFVDLFQERRQHFGILDDENRILIGDRRLEKNIGEPLHRADLSAVLEPKSFFAVNNEQ
jgi:hypothetical protein